MVTSEIRSAGRNQRCSHPRKTQLLPVDDVILLALQLWRHGVPPLSDEYKTNGQFISVFPVFFSALVKSVFSGLYLFVCIFLLVYPYFQNSCSSNFICSDVIITMPTFNSTSEGFRHYSVQWNDKRSGVRWRIIMWNYFFVLHNLALATTLKFKCYKFNFSRLLANKKKDFVEKSNLRPWEFKMGGSDHFPWWETLIFHCSTLMAI